MQTMKKQKCIIADVDKKIEQVTLFDFPTFKIQRELSKCGYFQKKDMKEVRNPDDPANPNNKLYKYENGSLKIISDKRIQFTVKEDKALILLLHNFIVTNGNPKKSEKKGKDHIKKEIALDTLSFIQMTCDDIDAYVNDGQIEINKLKNERKKIKSILDNLTSIQSIEYDGEKMTLFENGIKRNKLEDQFIVTFSDELVNLLSVQSKNVSISYRPITLFKLEKLPYLIGSYFSSYIYMKNNLQKDRNKLTVKSILNYLDYVIPSEECVYESRGSYARKIMDPVLNAFNDLEDNDIFNIAEEIDIYRNQLHSKSDYVDWKHSSIIISPANTAVEYNRRYLAEKDSVKKKEMNKTLKEQAKAVASGTKLGEAEATLLLEKIDLISNLLKVDSELLKKGIQSASKKSKQ